jgi:3-hydroxymyristoyl/3-hydroxydecanoyl-(acyl carrier protein) dehydratase
LHRSAGDAGRYAAFSFVDRILQFSPGRSATGLFRVPERVDRFPSTLAIEAVGQLAAWVAMAQLRFRLRPVAGVAGGILFGPSIRPGQVLELSVDIAECDEEAVKYSGSAHAHGLEVARLGHSLGPMLPSEDFDDAQALSRRFARLCGEGAAEDRYAGVPRHDIEIVDLAPGEHVRGVLRVPPTSTAFFSDHFPRRPVFPGTMLLDAQIELSLQAAAAASHWPSAARIAATAVPETKIRNFIAPGDQVELHTQFISTDTDGTMRAKTSSRLNGKQVALGSLEIADRSVL